MSFGGLANCPLCWDDPDICKCSQADIDAYYENIKMKNQILGGRDKYIFCGEMHNNVSYHAAHECEKRPIVVPTVTPVLTKIGPGQPLHIPSWDEQFMHDAYWWARRSKDPRTKIGAVLVKWEDKIPISMAYNSFSRKVNDNVLERWERPEKYEWVTHAEDNAVLNCARRGYSSMGTVMFTQSVPCTRCADACVQGGIIEVVVHKQWQEYEQKFAWDKWIDSAKRSEQKFKEAGIKIRVFDGVLGVLGVLDGKVINV